MAGRNRTGLWWVLVCSVALLWTVLAGWGQASQQQDAQTPSLGPHSKTSPANPLDDPYPPFAETTRKRRNEERQKRLEADSQRLLALANLLRSEVAASGAEAMTPEMIHQTEEIERLAKSVKDKMRS